MKNADKTKKNAKSIRNFKQKHGLTWPQMGEVFGVDKRTVEKWAAGSLNMSRQSELLLKMREDLGVPDLAKPEGAAGVVICPICCSTEIEDLPRSGCRLCSDCGEVFE